MPVRTHQTSTYLPRIGFDLSETAVIPGHAYLEDRFNHSNPGLKNLKRQSKYVKSRTAARDHSNIAP